MNPARKTQYLDFVLEWLSPLGAITARSMFGGYCVYCDGIVFAIVAGETLCLKVDDATRPRFEALGLKPFRPFEDRPEAMQFYPPPAEFFEDWKVMNDWGSAALEVGKRAQAKKKPRRGKRPLRRPK